jgi:hypothetical protein
MIESTIDNAIRDAAARVRVETEGRLQPLREAHRIVGDLVLRLVQQGAVEASSPTEGQSQRLSLIAGLIQSVSVSNDLIVSGFYWTAAAVLRQQMEAVARVVEIRTGKYKGGTKTPDVALLSYGLAQNYGRLSELAHTSRGELLADFVQSPAGEEVAMSAPYYRDPWAKELLCVHLAHCFALAHEIDLLHRELYIGRNLIKVDEEIYPIKRVLVDEKFWKDFPEGKQE